MNLTAVPLYPEAADLHLPEALLQQVAGNAALIARNHGGQTGKQLLFADDDRPEGTVAGAVPCGADRHIVDPPFPVKAVDDGVVPQLPLVIDMVIEDRDIRTGIDMLLEGRIEVDLPDEVCVGDDNIARPLVGEEPAVIRKKICLLYTSRCV